MDVNTEGWTVTQWEEVHQWVRRMRAWNSITLTCLTDDFNRDLPYAQRAAAQMLINLRVTQPILFGRL